MFGKSLVKEAEKDDKIVAITAAMPSGTGLDKFAKAFPERTFDVGIAEQHAVTFAAGLATEGYKPFCAIYSTFLQRAYDQVVHDVAIQSLPVRFAIDRAGLVGADGATHAGSFDIAYLGCLPNFVVMAAADEAELVHMVATQVAINDRPIAVRYPRGEGSGVELPEAAFRWKSARAGSSARARRSRSCRLAPGSPKREGGRRARRQGPVHHRRRPALLKPLDEELMRKLARDHEVLVTIEEGSIGGFGAHVMQTLSDHGLLDGGLRIRAMILPDSSSTTTRRPRCMPAPASTPRASSPRCSMTLGKDYKTETVKLA